MWFIIEKVMATGHQKFNVTTEKHPVQSIRLLLWQNWRSTVLAVFGKKSGDFHSKSGDREIFIILSKIERSPEKSGELEALMNNK